MLMLMMENVKSLEMGFGLVHKESVGYVDESILIPISRLCVDDLED